MAGADLYDAVDWTNLLSVAGPVMGYLDGPDSAWPPEAFARLGARVVLLITVLGDQRAPVFDSEAGNAGVGVVATAVANRLQDGKWSVIYTNRANLPAQTQALRGKSLGWTDAQFWPRPGVYLHAADPTGHPHTAVAWAPVQPVAVQYLWTAGYDVSACSNPYPYPPLPAPAPAPAGRVPMSAIYAGR